MMHTIITLSLLLGFHHAVSIVHSLSIITESPRAHMARSRLAEAFRSPSKKLTLHPELVLPEPSDPTALLLRSTEISRLSTTMRTKAKANALFVMGTVDALMPMGKEQENGRGNFPGPLPIVYMLPNDDEKTTPLSGGGIMERLRDVEGLEGILVPFFGGKEIDSVASYLEESKNHPSLGEKCGIIRDAGFQPIPEVTLSPGATWTDEDVVALVDAVGDTCGGGMDPVSIVFTSAGGGDGGAAADGNDRHDDDGGPSTPGITIPHSVSERLAFIGSVRTTAGDGRMNAATARLSSRNFQGAFLRADCVPGYRLNPDLKVVGGFWSAAIGDMKSLKSKNFNFRSKVKLEKDVPSTSDVYVYICVVFIHFLHYSFKLFSLCVCCTYTYILFPFLHNIYIFTFPFLLIPLLKWNGIITKRILWTAVHWEVPWAGLGT